MKRPALRPTLRSLPLVAFGLGGWALFLMGAGSAPSSTRLAVVDTARITSDSVRVQKSLSEASGPAEALRQQLLAKQKDFQSKAEQYSGQKSVATEAENTKRAETLNKLKDELEEITFRMNREVKKAQDQAVAPMRDQIMNAVRDLAKSQGVAVVIGTDSAVYYDPSVDLTAQVIKKIDGK